MSQYVLPLEGKRRDYEPTTLSFLYIKISAIESEEPFSGTTFFTSITKDQEKIATLIETSQKNWAVEYKRKEQVATTGTKVNIQEASDKKTRTQSRNGLPEKKKSVI